MRTLLRLDYLLLSPALFLVLISLTTLLSIQQNLFRSQLLSLIFSLVVFFVLSQIRIDVLKTKRLAIYFGSLSLLVIVLLLGIESRGAVRWLNFLGFTIQFSEILKPTLAVVLASYVADINPFTFKSLIKILLYVLPILLLIDLQPDLGNAVIYGMVVLFVLIIMGVPWKWFGLLFMPLLLISPFFWAGLHDYQRQRLLTFIHPTSDPLGASYNSIQAIIAIGSGALFGKGLSVGTQSGLRFLPERHTDFIFATIAEGLGFIGAIFIITLFFLLCFRIYVIYKRSNDPFVKLFSICCFAFFIIQCFVNIGMNIGYLPIVGVTLPFVSYGGSSLLSSFIFLGILSSLSTSEKHKDVLEIR